MEEKVYEMNPENCIYREIAYTEHDTGYTDYDCRLMMHYGKIHIPECCDGCLEYGCPLAFKYKIENENVGK